LPTVKIVKGSPLRHGRDGRWCGDGSGSAPGRTADFGAKQAVGYPKIERVGADRAGL
jgi:hypothetical protein